MPIILARVDEDALGPDEDALGPRLDQRSVTKIVNVRVGRAERIQDGGLDFGCREARDSAGLALATLGEHRGDVVAIADAALLAVLGVMRLPRSSKMRPMSRAPDAARLTRSPLRLAVSFS